MPGRRRLRQQTWECEPQRLADATVVTSLRTLAQRLHQAREEAGLTLRQLALRAGVAASTIQKIESGNLIPSVAVLVRVAEALGRYPSYFLDNEGSETTVRLVPAGQGRCIGKTAGPLRIERIAEPLVHPRMEAYRILLQPGAHSGQGLIFYRGEELVICLRGTVDFDVQGQRYHLQPGDTLHFKGNIPHTWRNSGADAAEIIMVCAFTYS